MQIVFETVTTAVGEMVGDILRDGVLIFFDHKAPKELHDVAVLHQDAALNGDIQVGDSLSLEGETYRVTFVGDKVGSALSELGHVSFKFNGGAEDLPGTVCVEAKPLPPIEAGMTVRIIRP